MNEQTTQPESVQDHPVFCASTKNHNEILEKIINERLLYDPSTGFFTWRIKPNGRVMAGSIAGHPDRLGYVRIRINKKDYLAHRIAWLLVYGYFPEHEVDHIDRNPSNNKISNLREVSHHCNMKNQKKQKNNSSGVTGVFKSRTRDTWISAIEHMGIKYRIGNFLNFDDAVMCRFLKEKEFGFHECNIIGSPAYNYLKSKGLLGGVL